MKENYIINLMREIKEIKIMENIKNTIKEMYAKNPVMTIIMAIVAIIALPVVLDIVFCVGNLVLNIVIFGVVALGAIYGFNYLKEKIMG